mgnify:CR=1 FL=1
MSVLDLIRARRDGLVDEHRLALVIEGGGSRGVYSSGMVLGLEELGLSEVFDAVYGTSAGALNAAWLLCHRARSGMRAWTDETIMRRVIDPHRLLRARAVFDLHYLVHHVYDGLEPMDFDAILANPTSFHPIGTDADTGAATDLGQFIVDKPTLMTALRATSNIPLLAGAPITLGHRRFLDGGIAESVPIHAAKRDGATHALVLRTRRSDEPRPPSPRISEFVGGSYMRAVAPGAFRVWERRGEMELADETYLAELENTVQIRPPLGSPTVEGTETGGAALGRALEIGRQAVHDTFAPVLV